MLKSSGSPVDQTVIHARVEQTGPSSFALHGDIDLAASAEVLQRLSTAHGESDLLVDCSGVDFIDASGLRVFVAIHQCCQRRGARLVVVNPTRCVSRLLELTRLDQTLAVRRLPSLG